jgi:hypothetical protein
MSILNFPTSPSLNDTYSFGTKTWIWNGAAWQLSTSTAINNIVIGNVTPSTGAFTTIVGTLITAAQPNITSVGTLTSLSVTGNVTANNGIFTTIVNTASHTGAVVSVSGNITGGNILTGGLISVTGNVTAGNVSATNFTGLASSATVADSANTVAGANVTGQVANALIAGIVYTAAQPNITSVGTLTSLSVTGNATANNGIFTTSVNTASFTGTTVSVTGNVAGNYFVGNGSQLTGIASGGGITWTTVANTAPSNAAPGDFWYNSYTDIKYQYTNDGTGNFWIDQSYPTSFSTLAVTGNITGGNISVTSIVGTLTTAAQTNITSVGTLGSLVVTGNVTGGNITTAGVITVNSGAAATAIVNGASNAVGNIGSATTYFNRLFAQATTALYADLAEVYKSDAEYPPGTVLVFGGSQEVTISTQSHDTRIAGVVSTNPAHVMNSGLVSEYTVDVGLIGRVPCQVIGPIAAGDRVVSSNRAGVAERLDMRHYQPGVIIGKAVESYNGTDVGTIEIVVGRL